MRLVGTTNTVYSRVSECAQITAGRGLRGPAGSWGDPTRIEYSPSVFTAPGDPHGIRRPARGSGRVPGAGGVARSARSTSTTGRDAAMQSRIVEHASTRYRRFVATCSRASDHMAMAREPLGTVGNRWESEETRRASPRPPGGSRVASRRSRASGPRRTGAIHYTQDRYSIPTSSKHDIHIP